MEDEMIRESVVREALVAEKTNKPFAREALLVAGSILLSSLIITGALLTQSSPKVVPTKGGDAQAVAPAEPTDTNATVSIDDDPILGDKKKAKVAIVEFSDYECPFCKRFHAETFDTLVKEYVNNGKAIVVARDFPLSFHDPVATMEAATAECVRKEKGDSAYFAFGKAVYANTVANGKGLPAGKLDELIRATGANVTTVTACAGTDAIKEEIAKDIADGSKVGINGTPSFVIGIIDEKGQVTGERVVGALPIDGFRTAIEKYLK
ncbi:MAG: DsbA family protein [Candidatus Moranbacteria bacterium]|nr:DsbA family protein [Candidatus Moranbacteria bacterium]